jgi:L-histidine Nalpha-methyltransferase
VIHVAIHASQFPERVRADLIESLRRREIKHKFHYDSYKQAQKWLALHEAHSPARTDARTGEIYKEAFQQLARNLRGTSVQVIGLGCGGGQKDVELLRELADSGSKSIYTAVDVSLPLVITARERASSVAAETRGVVCDLEVANDVADELCECSVAQRVFTFFGMIPNSEPDVILARLARLVGQGDRLLVSANLAPGEDYCAGVERVLPQYDNALTADWLFTFLSDLGVERGDGEVKFGIEECKGLLRIRGDFRFSKARSVRVESETFAFKAGESIRLFYSYRYTPERLGAELAKHGWRISRQWISPSGEEGVFLI